MYDEERREKPDIESFETQLSRNAVKNTQGICKIYHTPDITSLIKEVDFFKTLLSKIVIFSN